MAFTGAPVSKGLVIGLGTCTILAAVTARQHLFSIPLSPHLTRDWQLWRLPAHHLVFANSSEMFIATLILVYTSVAIERNMGTLKYASFLAVVTTLSTALELLLLVFGSHFGLKSLPAGPFALTFAIVSQSLRLVPTSFYWKIFGLELTNRVALYVLASQLLISEPPITILIGAIGLLSSQLYLSNFLNLRHYRIPPRLYALLGRTFSALFNTNNNGLDPDTAPRRHTFASQRDLTITSPMVAFPTGNGLMHAAGLGSAAPQPPAPATPRAAAAGVARGNTATAVADAPPPPAVTRIPSAPVPPPPQASAGFVAQWTAGISGSQQAPNAEQIAELAAIFPDRPRTELIAALSSNSLDTSRAAAVLLQS